MGVNAQVRRYSISAMTVYYVVVNGDRVAGPFETRAEAKREADTRATNEVSLHYGVEAAVDE
jgi:hypothetical protein